ncbi:MAG: hypothetical protein PVH87_26740 [Desulfobacteraceae bacterium]|jgi:hypothetical protein
MTRDIWQILGIEPTDDLRTIKRAYAGKIKENNPEDAPEKFQEIRSAYEIARRYANRETSRVNFDVGHDKPRDHGNVQPDASREVWDGANQDVPPQLFEPIRTDDKEDLAREINYPMVDRLVQGVVDAVRSTNSWDEEKRFKQALDELRSESVDTALQFELELTRELMECDVVAEDFLEILTEHYGWRVSYVRNHYDNELQYNVNWLLERSRESSREDDFVVVNPYKKESSGSRWYMWVLVLLAFSAVRACPSMESSYRHHDIKNNEVETLLKKFEKTEGWSKKELSADWSTESDPGDSDCVRLWQREEGWPTSIVSCEEWEKRREEQLRESGDFVEEQVEDEPSIQVDEPMRVEPYTFKQVREKLRYRRLKTE